MSIQQIISSFRFSQATVEGRAKQPLTVMVDHEESVDDKVHDFRGGRISTDNVTEAIRYQRDEALMNTMAAGLTTTRFGNL